MSYSEDIEAINYYITYGPSNNTGIWPKTDAAKDIANEWRRFYENISIWDDSQKNYDLARNIRNRFQAANSITVEEKKVAENVAKTGMTTEEMQRKARRTTNKSPSINKSKRTVICKNRPMGFASSGQPLGSLAAT